MKPYLTAVTKEAQHALDLHNGFMEYPCSFHPLASRSMTPEFKGMQKRGKVFVVCNICGWFAGI